MKRLHRFLIVFESDEGKKEDAKIMVNDLKESFKKSSFGSVKVKSIKPISEKRILSPALAQRMKDLSDIHSGRR